MLGLVLDSTDSGQDYFLGFLLCRQLYYHTEFQIQKKRPCHLRWRFVTSITFVIIVITITLIVSIIFWSVRVSQLTCSFLTTQGNTLDVTLNTTWILMCSSILQTHIRSTLKLSFPVVIGNFFQWYRHIAQFICGLNKIISYRNYEKFL